MDTKKEKNIHAIFLLSVALKGLNALLEIFLGVLLFFSGEVVHIITILVQGELVEDPTDFLATHIASALPYLSANTELFAAVYLLSHGLIKGGLVIGLLKNKLWAYPASLVFLALFIAYQLFRFTYTHSLFLILLTVFDLLVMWLVWHEYRFLKGKTKDPRESVQ